MNWFYINTKLLQVGILVIIFASLSFALKAQGCDFLENDSIRLDIINYNSDEAYTQQYALTSMDGSILDISLLPSFPHQNAGNYFVYALNYETATGISGFSIGNSISDIIGSCLDTVRATVNVCVCSTECHSTDGTVRLSISGANANADFTQSYALTNNNGEILAINTSPSSLNPLFSGQSAGNYFIYALNYETASGVNNYSIGNNITNTNGSCLDIEGPICYNICQDSIPCHSEDGSISVNNSGFTRTTGFTQSYALVDTNGIIQKIKDNPSTTQPLFIAVSAGDYQVYALNYETASGVNNYLVGNAINGVTGTCLDIAQSINYKVCPCPFTGCNSLDGIISFNINGPNQTATFTQAYALTDTFGLILQTSIAPNNTDSLFGRISTGYYHLYAANYETASGIMDFSVGNSIADVSGTCFDITGAFCYQVCNDNYDYGDLPDNSALTNQGDYQTLLVNNGPRHLIVSGLSLGDSIDMELDGIPDITAMGDGEDEDGLAVFSSLDIVPGMNFRLPFSYINTTGDTAFIEGWIDWNGDGDFDEINELVLDVNDGNGTTPVPNRWDISIPFNAVTNVYIGVRLRISLQDNMTPYGTQPNGEVEDYLLYLKCPKICLPIAGELKRG